MEIISDAIFYCTHCKLIFYLLWTVSINLLSFVCTRKLPSLILCVVWHWTLCPGLGHPIFMQFLREHFWLFYKIADKFSCFFCITFLNVKLKKKHYNDWKSPKSTVEPKTEFSRKRQQIPPDWRETQSDERHNTKGLARETDATYHCLWVVLHNSRPQTQVAVLDYDCGK